MLDLKDLSIKELTDLQQQITKTINKRIKQEKNKSETEKRNKEEQLIEAYKQEHNFEQYIDKFVTINNEINGNIRSQVVFLKGVRYSVNDYEQVIASFDWFEPFHSYPTESSGTILSYGIQMRSYRCSDGVVTFSESTEKEFYKDVWLLGIKKSLENLKQFNFPKRRIY